jgi:DNA-binding ferritin-like protein
MDIQIIKVQDNNVGCSLDTTRTFGLALNKALTKIKMIHWYVMHYNTHKIIGNLYEDLTDLVDKLQEEIIGTSRNQNKMFPQINANLFEMENIAEYQTENQDIMACYYDTVQKLTNMLSSQEFNNYISSVISGLNNTKEDMLSTINKANYLLSLTLKN